MKNIETILTDLYAIEPGLRAREKELRTLVSELLASQPDTKFDEAFARKLRTELVLSQTASAAGARSATGAGASSRKATPSPFSFFASWGTFQFGALGTALVVLLIIPFTYYSGQQTVKNLTINSGLTAEQKIDEKGSQAFGSIALNTSADGSDLGYSGAVPLGSPEARSSVMTVAGNARDKAGSEPVTPMAFTSAPSATPSSVTTNQSVSPGSSSASPSGTTVAVGVTSPSIQPGQPSVMPVKTMPPNYYQEIIRYVYNGDISIPDATAKVYKRTKGIESQNRLSSLIAQSNFELADLGTFSNVKVQNISLAEDRDQGYLIDLNFREGTISIAQDWTRWNNPQNPAVGDARVRPSETAIIETANAFLRQHKIPTGLYRAPYVLNYSGMVDGGPANTGSKELVYYDQSVSVIYPLTIDGLEVYDEGGMPFGLQVGVNVRLNKVVSVHNLNSQTYESAPYDLETDQAQIKKALNEYHSRYYGATQSYSKIKTTEVDAPQRALVRYWIYDGKENKELYVPALVFKVKGEPQGGYRSHVIIPLVKNNFKKESVLPQPVPMPAPVLQSVPVPGKDPIQPIVTPKSSN